MLAILVEIGNEPQTHKNIDTRAVKDACDSSGLLYSSGDYEESVRHFGSFLTFHSARDDEWDRKSHDAIDYWNGGGPHTPADPAHRVPAIADEPKRPDQAGYREFEFLAYFAGAAIMAGGATFHYEGGKFGRVPTDDEARCAAAALKGLDAFPADAPTLGYRRIDEQGNSLRTYVAGPNMVRVRPVTLEAPESGWISLEPSGTLWRHQ